MQPHSFTLDESVNLRSFDKLWKSNVEVKRSQGMKSWNYREAATCHVGHRGHTSWYACIL